jgi:uncharacterized protein (UPF0297 family)
MVLIQAAVRFRRKALLMHGRVICMDKNETMMFNVDKDRINEAREILMSVYQALKEKGYNPINQIVGYILSGDPTYITSHNNARSMIRRLERDELLEEIIRYYLEGNK